MALPGRKISHLMTKMEWFPDPRYKVVPSNIHPGATVEIREGCHPRRARLIQAPVAVVPLQVPLQRPPRSEGVQLTSGKAVPRLQTTASLTHTSIARRTMNATMPTMECEIASWIARTRRATEELLSELAVDTKYTANQPGTKIANQALRTALRSLEDEDGHGRAAHHQALSSTAPLAMRSSLPTLKQSELPRLVPLKLVECYF